MPMEQWNLTTASPPPTPPDSRRQGQEGRGNARADNRGEKERHFRLASVSRQDALFLQNKMEKSGPRVYLRNDIDARIRTCGYIQEKFDLPFPNVRQTAFLEQLIFMEIIEKQQEGFGVCYHFI